MTFVPVGKFITEEERMGYPSEDEFAEKVMKERERTHWQGCWKAHVGCADRLVADLVEHGDHLLEHVERNMTMNNIVAVQRLKARWNEIKDNAGLGLKEIVGEDSGS
jgi:hypothetical protein